MELFLGTWVSDNKIKELKENPPDWEYDIMLMPADNDYGYYFGTLLNYKETLQALQDVKESICNLLGYKLDDAFFEVIASNGDAEFI